MSRRIVRPRLATMLKDIPLEILDVILQNCYTYIILTEKEPPQTKDIVLFLASVNFCWFQRTRRKNFKTSVMKQLSVLYNYIEKRRTIIRNNRDYLLANLQPTDELLEALQSSQCLTKGDIVKIRKLRKDRDKNSEILQALRPFSPQNYSGCIRGLRQTGQHRIARVLENGGVVVKITTQKLDSVRTLVEILNDSLENDTSDVHPLKTKISEQDILVDKSSLEKHQQEGGIKKQIVVWLWLRAPLLFEILLSVTESKELNPSIGSPKVVLPDGVNVDCEDYQKVFGFNFVALKFAKKLSLEDTKWVYGITKMRHRIFVLSTYSSTRLPFIHVFQDEAPFKCIDNIRIRAIGDPFDIASSETKNCLYISGGEPTRLWMIREEVGEVLYLRNTASLSNGDFQQFRWIIQQTSVSLDRPFRFSISNDGTLLVPGNSAEDTYVNIYTPGLDLLKSFKLPRGMSTPFHALETSRGTVLVLHRMSSKIDKAGNGTLESRTEEFNVLDRFIRKPYAHVVSDFSKEGQFLGGKGMPQNEEQELVSPRCLALDSDDRVFVADMDTFRVVLLDSFLGWGQIIAETRQSGYQNISVREPFRLHLDKEKKQLIIIDRGRTYSEYDGPAVVYTLIQK